MTILLHIYYWICQWKKLKIGQHLRSHGQYCSALFFFTHSVFTFHRPSQSPLLVMQATELTGSYPNSSLSSAFMVAGVSFNLTRTCFYRQHCAKRKAPVFRLLRGRFWGFSPRSLNILHRWGWNLARSRGPRSPRPCQISTPLVQR